MAQRFTETGSRPPSRWFGTIEATSLGGLPTTMCGVLWAQAEEPLLYRLAPHQRAQVAAALAVVVLLGLGLILFAWWGARAVRRHYWRSHPTSQPGLGRGLREDDWATKPLVSEQGDPSDTAE